MSKPRGMLTVCLIVMMTVILLTPSVSAYWWTQNPPLITDHSRNPLAVPDVQIELRIVNKATPVNNRWDFTGTPAPPGEQVQLVQGKKFIWTCEYKISAHHTGSTAPPNLVACAVRVYLHYYWCPAWLDGSQIGNYQLLHSNWVLLTAYYDEYVGEWGMLHGIHQWHNNVVGEHYWASLSWWTQWNDGSWHMDVNDGKDYFYEII